MSDLRRSRVVRPFAWYGACLASGLVLGGCSSRAREHRPTPSAVVAPAAPQPTPDDDPPYVPPDQDFALHDAPPPDAPELLEAARHNCCDEMPAAEVRAAIRDAGSTAATHAPSPDPARLKAGRADSHSKL